MNNPRIVFCTTCKGRTEHLSRTLPQNIRDNADYPNCTFVVLDYCDPGPIREYLWANHRADMDSGRLAVYHFGLKPFEIKVPGGARAWTDIPFHMSHAKNMAHRCGIMEGADILVTLDADNFTGPGFARFIAEKFREPEIVLCPDFWLIRNLPHGPARPARGFYGRLAIRSQDFIKLGGYDEIFSVWGSEDADILARLLRLGYTKRHIDNCYLNTIPHNAEVRFKEYPEARQYENPEYIKKLDQRTETVVNYGKIGVGTVFKNFGSEAIEIGPVPTRIFGIGLQRTATTSLHRAFQILGFDSLHWGTGEAPRIWQEMHASGRSATLERWYAMSDLPIPLLYRKLDAAYPGSKFILTIRDEGKWLRSVERLWDSRFNPTRHLWDIWPISHVLHKALYGRETFDAQVFLERYRQHNAAVLEYFRGRPDDLLVMGEDNMGWPLLCQFLGVPVPLVSYPVESHMKKVAVPDSVPSDVEPCVPIHGNWEAERAFGQQTTVLRVSPDLLSGSLTLAPRLQEMLPTNAGVVSSARSVPTAWFIDEPRVEPKRKSAEWLPEDLAGDGLILLTENQEAPRPVWLLPLLTLLTLALLIVWALVLIHWK